VVFGRCTGERLEQGMQKQQRKTKLTHLQWGRPSGAASEVLQAAPVSFEACFVSKQHQPSLSELAKREKTESSSSSEKKVHIQHQKECLTCGTADKLQSHIRPFVSNCSTST
jgi:hypothetical protein